MNWRKIALAGLGLIATSLAEIALASLFFVPLAELNWMTSSDAAQLGLKRLAVDYEIGLILSAVFFVGLGYAITHLALMFLTRRLSAVKRLAIRCGGFGLHAVVTVVLLDNEFGLWVLAAMSLPAGCCAMILLDWLSVKRGWSWGWRPIISPAGGPE